MARRGPGLSEVVGRGDDSLAEVEQPDSVDHHARGQRMARLGQPLANARRRPLVCASFAGGDQANGLGAAIACSTPGATSRPGWVKSPRLRIGVFASPGRS